MTPLQVEADSLLKRWKQEMQRLPLPANVEVMEGEAGERMEHLAAAITVVVEDQESVQRFQVGEESYKEVEALGRLRRQQGFSIEELVQEHIIMRNEFWNLFREQVEMKKVVDFHLEKRVNSCFDLMLQAAASAYHYETSREMMENPLRDAATGLYNKSYMHGRMIEELRRSVRYEHDITLVLFELGNYFRIKEAESEEKAEGLLLTISSTLRRMTRDCDVVARMGESSFAVLLPETGWRGGEVMAGRLCRYFLGELPELVEGEEVPELRCGLASFPEEVHLPEKLYACTVEAMRSSRSRAPGEAIVYRCSESGEGG
jgi:diguanylate cyclase (GGDEF)-like protein